MKNSTSQLLLDDGGSTDNTLHIAGNYANVKITDFPEKTNVGGRGLFMNPESKHLNHAIRYAFDILKADWIVYDDMDSFPNGKLFDDARRLIEQAQADGFNEVYVRRYYFWGYTHFFPKLTSDNPPDNSLHSIWAWNKSSEIRGLEDNRITIELTGFGEKKFFIPDPPYNLAHYSWPDERRVDEKMKRYEDWGIPQIHPLAAFGALELATDEMKPRFRYDTDI